MLAVLMTASVVSCGEDQDKGDDTTHADTNANDPMALTVPKTDFDETLHTFISTRSLPLW